MCSYEYEVFISYKRTPDTQRWIKDGFKPMLEELLRHELAREAKVFADFDDVRPGQNWENRLAHSIAHSRVMVPLYSKLYFQSEWCVKELAAARYKEQLILGNGHQQCLVIPCSIFDSKPEDIPEHLRDLANRPQNTCFNDYYQPYEENTRMKYLLWNQIKEQLLTALSDAIKLTEDVDPEWENVIRECSFHCPKPAVFSAGGVPRMKV